MKSTLTKSTAIVAMIISLLSFYLMANSFAAYVNETSVEVGVGESFAYWIFGMIVAYISLIFYFADAVISIIKVFKKVHPVFNAILSIMLIGAIPMGLFVGGGLGVNVYIWNAYYLAIFILEIVSIVKHIKMKSSGKSA